MVVSKGGGGYVHGGTHDALDLTHSNDMNGHYSETVGSLCSLHATFDYSFLFSG